jgi:hypothetical protein
MQYHAQRKYNYYKISIILGCRNECILYSEDIKKFNMMYHVLFVISKLTATPAPSLQFNATVLRQKTVTLDSVFVLCLYVAWFKS